MSTPTKLTGPRKKKQVTCQILEIRLHCVWHAPLECLVALDKCKAHLNGALPKYTLSGECLRIKEIHEIGKMITLPISRSSA